MASTELTKLVSFLATAQQSDGSFTMHASRSAVPFVAEREQPTIFPTALILHCLAATAGCEAICQQAAAYLRSQVSAAGSWNYWERGSSAYKTEPYPDDLDDTACALAALTRYDKAAVDSTQLGQFARLLVAVEQTAGGPYNTWLTDISEQPQWQHVDLAVNCNVSYALSLHGVQLQALETYFETFIRQANYTSAFYIGQAPLLYFLARGYNGALRQALARHVRQALAASDLTNVLEQALLLTAGCQLRLPTTCLRPVAQRVLQQSQSGNWPAIALYPEPVYDGQKYYAGSATMTAAFMTEAMTSWQKVQRSQAVALPAQTAAARPVAWRLDDIRYQPLREQYVQLLQQIIDGNSGEQIAGAASLIARAARWSPPESAVNWLNAGSLNGWLAYTIYDNFLDDEAVTATINVANLALRRSYESFLQALPQSLEFRLLVQRTFDGIDSANAWELAHARAAVEGDHLSYRTLPSYASLSKLAERSAGHSLAATGLAMMEFGSLQHPVPRALQRYFKHFLIARQLNDDAHDWEEDLAAGRLTPVVCTLLKHRSTKTVNLRTDIDDLRESFWLDCLEEISRLIVRELSTARRALVQCQPVMETAVLDSWLQAIEQSVVLARRGKQAARDFITAFEVGA